jgi:hypothetical protein
MAEDAAHRTAGPWRVHPRQDRGVGVIIGTYVDDDALVAEAFTSIRPLDHRVIGDAEANAEYIVRACNAYERLASAAESAAESIEYVHRLLEGSEYALPAAETLGAAAAELRAALEEPTPPGARPR